MKILACLLLLTSVQLYAQNAESDLQKPISDLDEIQREEWQDIPTIYEVPIKNAPDDGAQREEEQKDRPSREIAPLSEEDMKVNSKE